MGKPLADHLAGLHSARVQVYRIRYAVHDDTVVVEVVRIAHRSDAYR